MTDTERAALRAAAEKASEGHGGWWSAFALDHDCGMEPEDAAYVSLLHPAAVLALLACGFALGGWGWRLDRLVYDLGLSLWTRPAPRRSASPRLPG